MGESGRGGGFCLLGCIDDLVPIEIVGTDTELVVSWGTSCPERDDLDPIEFEFGLEIDCEGLGGGVSKPVRTEIVGYAIGDV